MPSWEDEPLADMVTRPLTREEYKTLNQFKWDDLAGVPLKYVDHFPFARMEGARLIAPPRPSPYANIVVETLGSAATGMIQIAHKMDFYNLWLLEVQGALKGEFDVIIRHKRPDGIKRLFASILPHLEYSVYYKGYFDQAATKAEILQLLEELPYIYLYGQNREGLSDWIMDFNPQL